MSASGTFETSRDVRYTAAVGDKRTSRGRPNSVAIDQKWLPAQLQALGSERSGTVSTILGSGNEQCSVLRRDLVRLSFSPRGRVKSGTRIITSSDNRRSTSAP